MHVAKFGIKLQEYTAKNEGKIERILKPLETSRVLILEDKRKVKIKELLTF